MLRHVVLSTAILWPIPFTAAAKTTELKQTAKSPLIDNSNEELSGLFYRRDSKDLVGVADKDKNKAIYKINVSGNRYDLTPLTDITSLSGYDDYRASLANVISIPERDRRHDFEGIAQCGSTTYLADERVRKVIKVSGSTLTEIDLEPNKIKDFWKGGSNAGIEGIAVDCANDHLFIAKEREPRFILKFDLKDGRLLKEHRKLKRSDRHKQRVIDFNSGEGLLKVSDDISDLYYENGALYLLERYTREIVKLDARTFKERNRVSYFFAEFGLYQTPTPYGTAEALTMSDDKIYVGVDHNREHLSFRAAEQHGVSGAHGVIFAFDRPKGF